MFSIFEHFLGVQIGEITWNSKCHRIWFWISPPKQWQPNGNWFGLLIFISLISRLYDADDWDAGILLFSSCESGTGQTRIYPCIVFHMCAYALDKPDRRKPVAVIATLYLCIHQIFSSKNDTPHELIASHFHLSRCVACKMNYGGRKQIKIVANVASFPNLPLARLLNSHNTRHSH